jgi:LAO/AO transport system kinase
LKETTPTDTLSGVVQRTITDLVNRMMHGELQALSRLVSLVERDGPETPEIMKRICPHLGTAHLVGITGPPGGGKSTLVDKLTAIARKQGVPVGVIAVDPTSPFTGGALLGDRIRMKEHVLDPGVFIRSMASRGSHGGFPRTIQAVARLLDAFGKQLILEETVGVGQTEFDVVNATDTTIVVLVPEAGDAIQTIKAGLMEIAHIFVINKADREGAERLKTEVESMLRIDRRKRTWDPPVLLTQAAYNVGINELFQAIGKHKNYLYTSGERTRKKQLRNREELWRRVEQVFLTRLCSLLASDSQLTSLLERIDKGEIDIYTAADILDKEIMKKIGLLQHPE